LTVADLEGVRILSQVIAAGVVILGPVFGLWLWIDSRYAKKHSVATSLQTVANEIGMLRKTQENASEQMLSMERLSEVRHRELLVLLLEKNLK
jgi:hypothetical protein